jgi:hypothetical protein
MGGISNHFIEHVLKTYCIDFYGVFSANTIPVKLLKREKFSIVCNFSKATEPGSHFVTIIALPNRVLYLDSLGLPCAVSEISTFLLRLKKPVFHNRQQIQDGASKFCGFYCILFVLYFDGKKPSFNLSFVTGKLLANDNLCITYIKRLLK